MKVFLDIVKERLKYIGSEKWKTKWTGYQNLGHMLKLKIVTVRNQILTKLCQLKQRFFISKLRSGTFPIKIEIGRFRQRPLPDRLCKACTNRAVEDEKHFLIQCPYLRRETNTVFYSWRQAEHTYTWIWRDDELL